MTYYQSCPCCLGPLFAGEVVCNSCLSEDKETVFTPMSQDENSGVSAFFGTCPDDENDAEYFMMKDEFKVLQEKIYVTSNEKGFWNVPVNRNASLISYRHHNLSQELEILRKGGTAVPLPFKEDEDHQLFAMKLALIHSELSEALEGWTSPSDKIPEFTSAEEELADAVIRILDLAEHFEWDIYSAIKAKMKYNDTRPHLHGGKKF